MTKNTKRTRVKRSNLILTDKLANDLVNKATCLTDNTLESHGLSTSISATIESTNTSIEYLCPKGYAYLLACLPVPCKGMLDRVLACL